MYYSDGLHKVLAMASKLLPSPVLEKEGHVLRANDMSPVCSFLRFTGDEIEFLVPEVTSGRVWAMKKHRHRLCGADRQGRRCGR